MSFEGLMSPLLSITIGIVALLVGKRINEAIPALNRLSIPAPVSGGVVICFCLLVCAFAVVGNSGF